MIRAVTVYCSSSSKIPQVYLDAAAELGREIAARKWSLVYGGNHCGMMGVLADATRGAGGRVVGVTPQLFVDTDSHDAACDELVVTKNMRDRKAELETRGDAFIALPGGIGTFEEFFEILVGKQLGYHNKPLVLLNTNRFYEPLVSLFRHGLEQKFIRPNALQLFHVAPSVADALHHLETYRPPVVGDLSFEAAGRSGAK